MSTSEFNIISIHPKPFPVTSVSTISKSPLSPSQIGRIGKGLPLFRQVPNERKLYYQDSEKSHIIKFFPVNEKQLVRDSVSLSTYSRSNTAQSKQLLYRVIKTDGKIVRSILELSGFTYTESHDWNVLWLGCAPQLYIYEGLNENQRINHFPNSYEITRKDRMLKHLRDMQKRFGKEEFGFFPEGFVLPEDYLDLQDRFHSDKSAQWIVKPCNSSQGKGIFLLDNLASVQNNEPFVVSKYIADPLLLNKLKFDLRIYVLVTCYDPLRIYVYDEGLARFASETYSSAGKASKFSYLTNYSINKKKEKFVQNSDFKEDNVGHKWSLSALLKELEKENKNTDLIMGQIYDMIIKTIIAIEPEVVLMVRKLAIGRSNCFDLLGFDVIIDNTLKPWLLEVNLSPSLATDSPLDLFIKGNLVADTLNLIGLRYYDRKKDCMSKIKARIRAKQNRDKSTESNSWLFNRAHTASGQKDQPCDYFKYKNSIEDTLNESKRLGNFVRIYPSKDANYYEKFFFTPRGSNKTVYYYLFVKPFIEEPPKVVEIPKPVKKEPEVEGKKVLITGDDILIEYLARVLHAARSITVERLRIEWKVAIDRFVNHPIWGTNYPGLPIGLGVLNKLESRILEMKERQKKNEKSKETSSYYTQKNQVIKTFSALQIENILKGSKKNILKEIMSELFFGDCGILTDMIQFLAGSTTKHLRKNSVSRITSFNPDEFEKLGSKKG